MNAKRITTVFFCFFSVFFEMPVGGSGCFANDDTRTTRELILIEVPRPNRLAFISNHFAFIPDYLATIPDFRKDDERWKWFLFLNPMAREIVDWWEKSSRYPASMMILPWDADAELIAKVEDMSEKALSRFHWDFPAEKNRLFFYRKRHIPLGVELKLLKKEVDPPRIFPLIGPASLHHAHWECRVKYRKTVSVFWPIRWEYRSEPREHEMRLDGDYLQRTEEKR